MIYNEVSEQYLKRVSDLQKGVGVCNQMMSIRRDTKCRHSCEQTFIARIELNYNIFRSL